VTTIGTGAAKGVPVVLAGPQTMILLDASAGESLVAALELAVGSSDPLHAVFEALTRSGVRVLPSFVCAIGEPDAVRLLARGSGVALFRPEHAQEQEVSGSGVATWAEQVFRPPAPVALTVAGLDGCKLVFVPPHQTGTAPASGSHPNRATAEPTSGTAAATISPETLALEVAPPPTIAPTPDPPAYEGKPFDFTHLVGETRFGGVEAAAIRDPLDEPEKVAAADLPASLPPPSGQVMPEVRLTPDPPVAPAAPPPSPKASTGMIDNVPGSTPDAGSHPSKSASGRDPTPGDHDGRTITAASLRASLAGTSGGAPIFPPHRGRPSVQAVSCTQGHLNPLYADRCRICAAMIVDRRVRTEPRPSLGRLRFSDGLVVELDQPLLIGRKPTLDPHRSGSHEEPRLITIHDPEKVLSRVHAEIRLEDWQVLVIDRESVNSTFVQIPGQPLMRLRPGETCILSAGAEVNLGDWVSFVYEVAPP
jgi:hypothetical protein